MREWNDERGFGFIEPRGGGERVFVHIQSLEHRQRRPVAGDLLSCEVERDEQGRLRAARARFLETPRARRALAAGQVRRGWAHWVGGLFLVALAVGAALGRLPWWPTLLYALMSIIAFSSYRADKRAAEQGGSRTSEATLHTLELLGGWPGAVMAQHWLRHKNRKRSYQLAFWTIVVLNLLALTLVLASDDPQQSLIDLLRRVDRLW